LTYVICCSIVSFVTNQHVELDRIFRALADPTRRAVLQRLSGGVAPVSELAEPFDMALPSFLQHLKVLEGCGLVRSRKSGRIRTYQMTPAPLRTAEGWMSKQRALWERRLNQLDRYLEDLKPPLNPKRKKDNR
jgi:DNA-binding transcriptional ArsR family regulator